mmetsp:Transcript_77066/g.204558  ORF Transcript_77066/g.204558 Transcript_77066/m.204558 type:complete len:256 (-) Transcript_77066:736-1503(-)
MRPLHLHHGGHPPVQHAVGLLAVRPRRPRSFAHEDCDRHRRLLLDRLCGRPYHHLLPGDALGLGRPGREGVHNGATDAAAHHLLDHRSGLRHIDARRAGPLPALRHAHNMPVRPGPCRRIHLLLRVPPQCGNVQGPPASLCNDGGLHGTQHCGGPRVRPGRRPLQLVGPAGGVLVPRHGVLVEPDLSRADHPPPWGRRAVRPKRRSRQGQPGRCAVAAGVRPASRLDEAARGGQEPAPRLRRHPHCHGGHREGLR